MDLLKEIEKEDIELLLADLAFLEQGYEILYVLDPSDVFSYTFPYGIRFNLINKISPDDIGDMLIAYEFIFRHYDPIILDEYKLELILNRNLIKANADKRLESNTLKLTLSENAHLIDDFSKSSTFLLATSLLQEKFINKFDDVFHNQLQIDNLKLRNKCLEDEKIIDDLFKNTRKSDWSKTAFTNWVSLQGRYDYNNFEVAKEFKSTLRDFIALDRIIELNKNINNNVAIKNKYLILYFSGAKKSLDFFKQKELLNHLPNIGDQVKYNLLRTPKHSFLLFLIYNKDLSVMKNVLEEFKDIAIKKEGLKSKYDEIKESEFFEQLNIKRRALIEKTFIESQINQHQDFKDEIENLINSIKGNSDYNGIRRDYENLLENAKQANAKTELIQTNSSYLLQGSLIHLIQKLSNNEDFAIYKGVDLIKGAYHHLPILIFFDKDSIIPNSKLEALYIDLVEYTIAASNYKTDKLKKLVDTIKNVCSEIESFGDNKEYYYEILIKVFILLFIEKAENIKKEVAEIIEDGYEYMEHDIVSFSKWNNDYIYTLIWVLRRINELDKCLYYCNYGIEKFPNDPRFYHGRALCLYNKYFKKDSLEPCSQNNLTEIISETEKAINFYKLLLDDKNQCREEFEKFIRGSISALKNLLLYSISLFYLEKLEKSEAIDDLPVFEKYSITYLREHLLKRIRNIEDQHQNPTKSWPEYAHTEAILELIEAIYNKNKSKITHSLEAINLAMKSKPDNELYKKTKLKIENWRAKI